MSLRGRILKAAIFFIVALVFCSSSSSFVHSKHSRSQHRSGHSAKRTTAAGARIFTVKRPSPRFEMSSTNNDIDMDPMSDADKIITTSTPSNANRKGKIHTHYVFLIHGWLGNSSEMSYLEKSLNKAAAEYFSNDKNSRADHEETSTCARFITHSAICNNGRTTDGIASGGDRLAEEVQQFIIRDMQINGKDQESNIDNHQQKSHRHVSVSIVGNSLGGLYARYALSKIPSQIKAYSPNDLDDDSSDVDVNIMVHPEIFATTATPHLGVASNTFLPIPRALEHIIGRTLKTTGMDLFRMDANDLIYQMCTDYELYLKPLAKFQKRIAYINAFRTDFQVPTGTAAFLNQNSTYPHSIQVGRCKEEGERSEEEKCGDDPNFVVAVANTRANEDVMREELTEKLSRKHVMSIKLDASGWEKVFIDVREYIPLPGFAFPSFMKKSSRQKWNEFLQSKVSVGEGDGEEKKQGELFVNVQSKELEKFMTGSDRIDVPVGHQVMVANSKSDAYSNFTKNGRPVMDDLSRKMVKWLFRSQ